ncbi:MAG TPA: YqfO family protein [Marinobacterium sp.]|nr:YqfO family protein [Marinobacterium sp.]
MYKLIFFVPPDSLDAVKSALFAAGAGRQGNYQQCCWQTLGTGQFCPVSGANPAIGNVGKLEQLQEWRVEMICDAGHIRAAVDALLEAHPYEEVAYDLLELVDPANL